MSFWTFLVSAQSWTLNGSAYWEEFEGHGPGCLVLPANSSAELGSLSLAIATGEPASMWVRVVSDEIGAVGITLTGYNAGAGVVFELGQNFTVESAPYDSGWLKLSDTSPNTDTVTELQLVAEDITAEIPAAVYVDSIYVAEAEPGGWDLTHSAGGMPGSVII